MDVNINTAGQYTAVIDTEDNVFICSECGDIHNMDVCIEFDDHELCPECADSQTLICCRCGERIWNDDNEGDDNITLCSSCYEHHYTTCDRCGHVLSNNDIYSSEEDDAVYCYSCYCRANDKRVIHEYSYKPSPVFFPYYEQGSMYMGIELEIDHGGKDSHNAQELLNIGNKYEEQIYIKHDGSLEDGLEIVSYPATPGYHLRHMKWKEICAKAVELGYTSHLAGTCGLHIHVSRECFGSTIREQEEVIARILYFVEAHFNEMLCFSRRTQSQLDRWAARYGYKDQPKDILYQAKSSGLGRYTAVNLQNYDTIEFRMFRGTLKYNTFAAAIQLVQNICNAAVSMSDEQFKAMSWQRFVSGIQDAQELIEYLKIRRLYVNEEITSEEDI